MGGRLPLRRVLVAVVVLVSVALPPAHAVPVDGRVIVHGSRYYPGDDSRAPLVVVEGMPVRFTDLSILGHTLTADERGADGLPLFDAGPVPAWSSTVAVEGVEALPARAEPYGFHCEKHLGMHGSLVVI